MGFSTSSILTIVTLLTITTLATRQVHAISDEQFQQLNDLADRRAVIRLNVDKFKKFVGSQSVPRNYSFIVMMTALSPQRSCHICRQAYEEFQVTANSYKASQHHDSKRLYFGLVDYDEGQDIFNSLNLNSAPCFLYFDEKGNFKSPDELNLQTMGFGAEVISRWITEKTGMSFKIMRPPSLFIPIAFIILGTIVGGFLSISRDSLTMIFNRNVWAACAVSIVFLMTSGQMWNHIRGAPLMHRGRNQNVYIHASSSGQLVIETYIVMLIEAGISLSVGMMIEGFKSGDKTDPRRSKWILRTGFGISVLFFSILLYIFRQKSYGYPYKLLF